MENCQTGTRDWEITYTNFHQAADNHQVEGYASKTSVNAGEEIRFYISTTTIQPVDMEIYRLGYYNGMGARLVHFFRVVNVFTKALPVPNSTTGIAEANWISEPTAAWFVPATAVSGFYVVKLTGTHTLYQNYIPFVVRNDSRTSPLLFKIGVNTHQAYNGWPDWVNCDVRWPTKVDPCDAGSVPRPENGKSLYPYPASGGPRLPGIPQPPESGTEQARKVSFNRPYGLSSSFGIYDALGKGFANYEYPMIRWIEKEGYDVTYITDVDADMDPQPPTNPLNQFYPGKHKVMLSAGHDEYWSWRMRDNVEKARNHASPLNLAFFGGNNVYWQIRYENSSSSNTWPANASNRTIVCYKETARGAENVTTAAWDPTYFDNFQPTPNLLNDFDIADLWRRNVGSPAGPGIPAVPAKPPEDELVGVMTIPPNGDDGHPPTIDNGFEPIYCCGANRVVFTPNAPAWLLAGTTGEILHNLIGYESDELYSPGNNYPNHNSTIVVASSPFFAPRTSYYKLPILIGTAETTFYTMSHNGAKVFAASGQQWAWGLDDWGADGTIGPIIGLRLASQKQDAQRITKNILDCFSTYASCGT